ncbi:hypothetical protein EVAR_74251_1 [Eumeta japonica]|uniref:Uncharacterized protein n=1 Tax=Eumeta variegata TaxID=151549 RepID=A0A4C1SDD9_EUMVA|nr:hypothetical protein EVAR_74251_1 [Eumeta japonica]
MNTSDVIALILSELCSSESRRVHHYVDLHKHVAAALDAGTPTVSVRKCLSAVMERASRNRAWCTLCDPIWVFSLIKNLYMQSSQLFNGINVVLFRESPSKKCMRVSVAAWASGIPARPPPIVDVIQMALINSTQSLILDFDCTSFEERVKTPIIEVANMKFGEDDEVTTDGARLLCPLPVVRYTDHVGEKYDQTEMMYKDSMNMESLLTCTCTLRLGVTYEKGVTLGNVTMSHRTRERPAECLASLSHSTMIGLPRAALEN